MKPLSFKISSVGNYYDSTSKEILLTNTAGTYFSTTISCCNTRKYHGLLNVLDHGSYNHHVLLSALDETVMSQGKQYELATHQYPGTISPQGYKYLVQFDHQKLPTWRYKLDDTELEKSIILRKNSNQLLICYEVIKASHAIKLQLRPFLAFRKAHELRKADLNIDTNTLAVDHGAGLQPYGDYGPLYLQLSRKTKFVAAPDWYYSIEYPREQEKGYDFREDLYVPGYFEVKLKQGDKLIVSVSLTIEKPGNLKRKFQHIADQLPEHNSYEDYLKKAADQFIIKHNSTTTIMAGWYWFGAWGRDTFIALPGLTLATNKPNIMQAVLDTAIKNLKDGLFPNTGNSYNSVDAPLWFCWAVQQYASHIHSLSKAWEHYGDAIKSILTNYRNGTHFGIAMCNNGLIKAGETGYALTWMDAIVNGQPVTPRRGMPVEVNALWYNAVCFALEAATKTHDQAFVDEWHDIPEKIKTAFNATFWDKENGYLADVVHADATTNEVSKYDKDWSIRPNQAIATSLPHSPLSRHMKAEVLDVVKAELLTTRGLRTLNQWDPDYRGRCIGTQANRDLAYHQGTVWPWLLGHFAEGFLKVHGSEGVPLIEALFKDFEETLFEHGVGTVSEIFDGDEPHYARGAVAQAWSVAELLRTAQLIKQYKKLTIKRSKEDLIEHS